MKIVELTLNDNIISGVDTIALVEEPAIEQDFYAFSAQKYYFETYNDYPQSVKDSAEQGIKRNEALGNPCATQVGKVRAQQLVNGEKLSLDTIRRMRSFLIRQKDNYELARGRRDYDACGYISYLLWGGESALPWAEKKLRQAGEKFKEEYLILNTFAEVGPRGGIKASPKAPKSDTPNPNPKGKGTAKGDASSSRGAQVDKQTEESLQKKADEFNEKYKDKLGYGANIGALKSVYQRGIGAYNTSHSPNVSSAKQWGMARVNAFLYLIKNGRPQNKNYTQDNDLLPTKHPKREQLSAIVQHLIFHTLLEQQLDLEVNTLPNYVNEQRRLIGALMEPNKLIRRLDEETDEEYFVFFTEDTIKLLAERFMKTQNIHSTNIEHNGIPIDGVSLIETWIVEDTEYDKTNLYNQSYPKGTWVAMYKIDNDEVWDKVKNKEIKGFSVEGLFEEVAVN
jgi:hypothetical protein